MSLLSSLPERIVRPARIALWSIVLWSATPQRDARAETALHYKFQSWQEGDGRIRVDSHYAEADQTWASGQSLRLVGLVDTIAGATPTGQPAPEGSDQVPLSYLEDRRESYQVEFTQPFENSEWIAGYGSSKESDYYSDVWSLNGQFYFNQKNTTLRTGYARADDDVTAIFLAEPKTKKVQDAIIGITQVLSPRTSITANLTYGLQEGFLSDPYKIVEQQTEILPGVVLGLTYPENRPSKRERLIGYFSTSHAFEQQRAALEASYRIQNDDWGVTSHTLEAAWFQRVGERVILRPYLRYYRQSEADFYVIDLTGSPIVPSPDPDGTPPHYSADYRLSEMETWTLGFKAVWEVTPTVHVDATYERYLMNGLDGRTSASAYSDANVFTVGVRLWL